MSGSLATSLPPRCGQTPRRVAGFDGMRFILLRYHRADKANGSAAMTDRECGS
ncbi:hypothetical protein MCEGEM3_02119 [Oxalobacteraceae bacterium]